MSTSEKSVADEEHASPPLAAGGQITLQVGERRFVTTTETITQESRFFAALLSGRWDNAQADGSYFIDADPELFEHILRFLRRGVFPIFYDNTKGHDYALYLALLQEASYFQIPRLENWLLNKEYLHAIKIKYSVDEVNETRNFSETRDTDEQSEYLPQWRTRQVYICPREIEVHKGDPSRCGRQCRSSQGDGGRRYEDEDFLTTLIIRRQTVFNPAAGVERF